MDFENVKKECNELREMISSKDEYIQELQERYEEMMHSLSVEIPLTYLKNSTSTINKTPS